MIKPLFLPNLIAVLFFTERLNLFYSSANQFYRYKKLKMKKIILNFIVQG